MNTALMKQELEESLGRPVDIVRLHKYLDRGFRGRIEQEVIYV